MKTIKLLILACIVVIFAIWSCSSDDSGSKVGIQTGRISLTYSDSTVYYNIASLQTVIDGDTSTIVVRAENADSSGETLVIGFQKIVNFRISKYDITGIFDFKPDTPFVYAYIFQGFGGSSMYFHFPKGSIDVVDYYVNNILQAKLSLEIPDLNDTATGFTEITGELNLDYADFDPDRVANLPIDPGTMHVTINDSSTTLKANSAHINAFGVDKYSINGTLGAKTVVIELIKLGTKDPKINVDYLIGETVDSIKAVATYSTSNETTFWADSGYVKLSKISSSTLQGYFDFEAHIYNDKNQTKTLKNGMFYTRMKLQ
jgi:hypothetical protein